MRIGKKCGTVDLNAIRALEKKYEYPWMAKPEPQRDARSRRSSGAVRSLGAYLTTERGGPDETFARAGGREENGDVFTGGITVQERGFADEGVGFFDARRAEFFDRSILSRAAMGAGRFVFS